MIGPRDTKMQDPFTEIESNTEFAVKQACLV